jgi:enoyl-CoA hydratase/carnithine racemase
MEYQTILMEKKEHIAIVTLNRPERMNAVNAIMSKELMSAFSDVGEDNMVRVVIVTGAGRGFCSGGDVTTFVGGSEHSEEERDWIHGATIIRKLREIPKPTIAMVNGPAVGGGCALALTCDLRIGSEKARFMNAFVRVGLASGWGGPWLYPRMMGLGKALEILFTGDFLEAKEAERIGVLNRLVPAEKLQTETMLMARKIASGPPLAIQDTKLQIYEGLMTVLETALRRSDMGEYYTVTTEDHREGVRAFLEKRSPVFKGR